MNCKICKIIPKKVIENKLGEEGEPTSKGLNKLEKIGGYTNDRFDEYLKKCPSCGTYYLYTYHDSFESGGAVTATTERITTNEAKKVIKEILEELNSKKSDRYASDLDKLNKELKKLQTERKKRPN